MMTQNPVAANTASSRRIGQHNFLAFEANRFTPSFVSIENAPMMRKSGLTPIFSDENSSNGDDIFNASGQLKDHAQCERVDNFLHELMWMATLLQQRREISMPN